MKSIVEKIDMFLAEQTRGNKWSGKVKTKFEPKASVFKNGTAAEIAKDLTRDGADLKTAMSRLDFYLNRAGTNIKPTRRVEIEKAKEEIRKLFKKG